MNRLSSWALPIILGVAGVALIIIGTLDLDRDPVPTLPPIAAPTPTPVALPTPTASVAPSASAPPSGSVNPSPSQTPTPLPDEVIAVQLDVPSVGIRVAVRQSEGPDTDGFPPSDAAYILSAGSQPGRNTNAFIFAHALQHLFKPLWNVQPGAEILIQMSDGQVLRYVINEVRPNVPCPDPSAVTDNPPDPPLALQIHDDCEAGVFWTQPTPYERLTLQTSQGYNRNWGELVIVADPIRGS